MSFSVLMVLGFFVALWFLAFCVVIKVVATIFNLVFPPVEPKDWHKSCRK